MMHKESIALAVLWSLPLLAYSLGGLARTLAALWRGRGTHGTFFILLSVAAAFYAYPSSAQKGGGGTNTPPPAVSGASSVTVQFYFESPSARMWPIGSEIRRIDP